MSLVFAKWANLRQFVHATQGGQDEAVSSGTAGFSASWASDEADCVDWSSLVHATYFLEGDGFLAPFSFAQLSGLNDFLLQLERDDEMSPRFAGLRQFAQEHRGSLLGNHADELAQDVWRKRTVLTSYWKDFIWIAMTRQIDVFKGLCFEPNSCNFSG